MTKSERIRLLTPTFRVSVPNVFQKRVFQGQGEESGRYACAALFSGFEVKDGRTIIKEKIYLDNADRNILHDEITTIDNALTRPWTVVKNYRRVATNKPIWWREDICAENNVHVVVGKEDYFLSADGLLMPIKKDQPPPDLRYFNQSGK